eukprot:m.44708 g.44708  ORF g.44708 m.44708 type:complete len:167 (+) comp12123_c0_seq2:253-753(+)
MKSRVSCSTQQRGCTAVCVSFPYICVLCHHLLPLFYLLPVLTLTQCYPTGHMSILLTHVRRPQVPDLHDRVVVPKALSTDLDEHLQSVTSGFLDNFTHERAPALLRTKSIPDIEARNEAAYEQSLSQPASTTPSEALQAMDQACERAIFFLESQKKEFDTRTKRRD